MYDDTVMVDKAYYNKLKEQTTWISVKDRLPEKTGTYIVYMANGFSVDVYIKPQHAWALNQASITHWMPLPLLIPPDERMI